MIDSKVTTILPPFFFFILFFFYLFIFFLLKNFKHRHVGRQMTKVLHCSLKYHFGQAYLKLDPKNHFNKWGQLYRFLGSESAFSSDTLDKNEI